MPSLVVHVAFVSLVVFSFFAQVDGVLYGTSDDDLRRLFPEYEIVQPFVVSYGGEFISHDLKNVERNTHKHYLRRRKRSMQDLETIEVDLSYRNVIASNRSIDVRNDMFYDNNTDVLDEPNMENNPLDKYAVFQQRIITPPFPRKYFHFNVSAFGSRLQLKVESKTRLLAPGAKSVLFTADGKRIEKDLNSGCLLFGNVPQDSHSRVAISNCNGLAGLIQTENEEFFIEPIEEQEDVHVPQRHVIYRRSVVRSESIGKRMDRERTKRDLGPNESVESLGNSVQKVLSENQDRIHKHKRHTKRSEYNIEILLTADSEVVNFHGRNHVENYLLTLVNIVDEIYHDSSLGEHINIVLSRLYQLDEERSRSLIIDDNASTSLKNVCKWAHAMHQTDPAPHGRSPDHAIFLTRRRFGPAGYAHVSGMCHPLRSCSLNHEDGFSSSFVVAHETGHVLGMEHDGEGNKCGDETSMGSIMAPLVQAAFHRYHWSRCSQQELKRNLRKFTCLRDDPHSPDWGPTPAYPGVTYSMDDQCRFDFGQGYRRCTAFRNLDVCKTLWCSHDDNPLFCKTKKGPPVDGTECGENMWCFKSHCVWRDQRQAPINGNWSAWSPYSECSRSCGTGVMYRSRMCDNPPPSHGGSECVGKNVDYDLCNKRSCSARTDFRADQCSYRNDLVEYKGQRHKWLPYEPLDADLKCDLFCVSKKTNDVVTMGDIVADGTLCSYDDPHSICIRGECVEIGCDKMMGSARREDDCGVCGGDGRQCRNIHGEVKKRVNRKLNNYIKLYKIPAGARHIRIQEASPVDNTNLLALKSRADKRYFLNAKARRIPESETPRKIIHSGSMWSYDSQQGKETITCRGPINSDVILLLLIQRRNVKAIVRYSYVAHVNDVPKPRDTYRYEIRRWSPCSGRCGSGHKRAKYGCRSQTGNKWVSKRNCKGKPPRSTRQPCRVECRTISRWETGDWGPCSKTCGSEGFQRRDVTCHQVNHQGVSKVTDDSSCQSNQRPIARKICYPHPCPPRWRKGAWSDCSASCGPGTQRRQVICRTLGIPRAFNPSACTDARPIDVQSCESVPCIAEVAVALSTTTTGTTTTNPATTIADNCVRDQSIFCSVDNLGQYCAIGSYRKLCCKSCRKVLSKQSKQDSATGRSVHNKPPNIAIQSAIANITANSDQDLDKETIFTNQAGPPITPSADDNVIINPPINVTTGDISETPDQDGSMSDDDVIVEVVDDMTDVAASDAENVGYYDESMNNEYMDGGDDLQEFILTLPPPSDAEEPTSVADHHVMLANKRKGSATVPGPTDDSVPSRRKRSVNDFSLVLKDWSECYVKECGAGIRHSIYGCWNNVNQAWTEMEHCPEATTLTTACFMPCYSVSGNSSDRRIEFQSIPSKAVCREFKRDGLGPRTSSIKCRGLRYRKTYSQFSSVQRHHFTTRTSSRKMRASLREKRERNVDGS